MRKLGWMIGAAVALSWGTALADDAAARERRAAERVKDTVQSATDPDNLKDTLNIDTEQKPEYQVSLNGGVTGFTGVLGDSSRVGPMAGVTVGSTLWNFLGIEGGYEGSRNGISDPRVAVGDQAIYRHNLSALAKVGPRFENGLKPFVGAGLGASYVNISDGAEGPFFRNDFMGELPVAAGVDLGQGNLHAGVRTTFRFLVADEFQELTPALDNTDGGLLSAQLTVGGRF